jgi:transcriptional regulator with XRE-family HTH domain
MLSDNIRRLREERDWSQEELGKRAGVSGVHICTIEKGTRRPSLDVLDRIAQALGVSASSLLREEGSSHAG